MDQRGNRWRLTADVREAPLIYAAVVLAGVTASRVGRAAIDAGLVPRRSAKAIRVGSA